MDDARDGVDGRMSDGRAGMWRMFAIILAVVTLGLAAALTQRQDTGAATAPSATVTVTVTATPGAADAVETGDQAAREQWLLEVPRRVADDPMAKGAVDAPVVLTEWADYRCPFCNVWAEDTLPLLQPFVDDGSLRIEFRDLAIFGDDSVSAAAAARAAGEQGLFWEFQAALYGALPAQGHPPVDDALVERVAGQIGVPDLAAFMTAYRSEETRAEVVASSTEAQQMGISSTPTFLIGSEVISGAQPVDVFKAVIQEQLAKHG